MINRYVEVTNEYVKQLEQEIDNLKKINEEHKKINGKLREEYNKIQNLYESVFAESQKQKEVIDKAIEFIEWFRKDNMEFYKNKGVALTISECDGLLDILKEGNKWI